MCRQIASDQLDLLDRSQKVRSAGVLLGQPQGIDQVHDVIVHFCSQAVHALGQFADRHLTVLRRGRPCRGHCAFLQLDAVEQNGHTCCRAADARIQIQRIIGACGGCDKTPDLLAVGEIQCACDLCRSGVPVHNLPGDRRCLTDLKQHFFDRKCVCGIRLKLICRHPEGIRAIRCKTIRGASLDEIHAADRQIVHDLLRILGGSLRGSGLVIGLFRRLIGRRKRYGGIHPGAV